MGGQRHAPAALPPEKTRYSFYTRLDGPQGRSVGVRKNLALTRIRYPDRPARSESLYGLSYADPKTSETSYNSTLRKISEERRAHSHRGGSLK